MRCASNKYVLAYIASFVSGSLNPIFASRYIKLSYFKQFLEALSFFLDHCCILVKVQLHLTVFTVLREETNLWKRAVKQLNTTEAQNFFLRMLPQ